ncbi:hypothetical protein B0H14DRAFT_2643869 [Mycena olivaceomarginata]|nr:hypothetical protein B0H14DRAFT_2643869 [Mycena olivaceomarginata]
MLAALQLKNKGKERANNSNNNAGPGEEEGSARSGAGCTSAICSSVPAASPCSSRPSRAGRASAARIPARGRRRCMCGKKEVGTCAAHRSALGAGPLMACGWHRCERVCHPADGEGGCGPCAAVCGKSRKACLPLNHPCTQPCHVPSSCDESVPCSAVVTVSCACGPIRQPVSCGRTAGSAGNGNGNGNHKHQQPKCTNECLVTKRNARLADALGIMQEGREQREREAVVWLDDVLAFGRANAKFVVVVEKAFAEFCQGPGMKERPPETPSDPD